MTNVFAARAQMGTSLLFHIIFSVLGVGIPLLLCLAEGIALRRKDPEYMTLARRWATAGAIIFAIGAVSGTVVEFELGLLWPSYIKYTGAIVGPLFAFEGFAFFLEAIFFGIYLYGWNRLPPFIHWLTSLPIVIGGFASSMFITTTNAWMNTPAGFHFTNGKLTSIDTVSAIFNPSTPYETVHMTLASYVAVGFGVAAVYAFSMLRGKRDSYRRKGMMLALAVALIATPLQIVSGDFNARYLVTAQPAKLAAMEGVYKTSSHVPVKIGGIPNDQTQTVDFAIPIPDGLSLLAGYNPNTVIKGLNEYKPQDRPNPQVIHPAFDGMVGSGFFDLFIAVVFWGLYLFRKRVIPDQKLMLWGILLAGPLAFLATELGWIVTEEGRQPFAIYGVLRTSDAATSSSFVSVSLVIFVLLYIILGTTLVILLIRQARTPLPEMTWEKVTSGAGSEHQSERELVGV